MRRITLKLTARADGRFAKRIDGQYFVWPDEETARAAVIELARRRELGVSDSTVPATPTDPPLRTIANLFRAARKPHVQPGTWDDYETAIDGFLVIVGKYRFASSLRPNDFAQVREKWDGTLGPWKLDNRVQSVRSMFRWACKTARLIDREPWYGDAFHKSKASDKRRVARQGVAERGERKFTTAELRKILDAVDGPLRAFVLLGLNGGMYAADIAQLVPADFHTEGRFQLIDNDRIKTGVRRKFILWPETIDALRACRRGTDRMFMTFHGNPWVNGETNSIALLFGRLLNGLGIKRRGVGFGALRHTHVSAVGGHHDHNAASVVRGHLIAGITVHYDFPDVKRLKAITDLARARLVTSALRQSSSRRKSA
jgi:integrase